MASRDRRDVHRQVALPAVDGGHDEGNWLTFVAAGPTPDEAVALAEALEQRIRSLGDPLLMQIALKKLEGYANKEIAQELDYTERTIERKLEMIRRKWDAPGRNPTEQVRLGGRHVKQTGAMWPRTTLPGSIAGLTSSSRPGGRAGGRGSSSIWAGRAVQPERPCSKSSS